VLYQLSYASPNSAHTPAKLTNAYVDFTTADAFAVIVDFTVLFASVYCTLLTFPALKVIFMPL
jgi:hypothetical protein